MEHLNNPIYAWGGDVAALTRIIEAVTQHKISAQVEAARPSARQSYFNAGGVAVMNLVGPMIPGVGAEIEQYFGVTDTKRLTRSVQEATADESVESILFRVNSPGGSVDGLDRLGDAVAAAVNVKPVAAVVDGMAASAAYYTVAQAHTIYAGRRDLVGSIGTRLTVYDYSEAFQNAGIKPVVIDTGEYKSMGERGTPITDEHKAEFQRLVDGYFADFRDVVVRGRGMTAEGFEKIGDGRLFFADESRGLGLIDGISDVTNVLNSMQTANAARRRVRSL